MSVVTRDSTYSSSSKNHTSGGVLHSHSLGDLREQADRMLENFIANCRVAVPSNDDDSMSDLGQISLDRNWKQVLALTSSLLPEDYLLVFSTDTINKETFTCRIEALFKLKLFDELITFTNSFLSLIENQPQPLSSRLLSLSIVLKLVICEVITMTGRGDEAVERLYSLEKQIEALSNSEMQLQTAAWIPIIWMMHVNILIRQHQWPSALKMMQKILNYSNSRDFEIKETTRAQSQIAIKCLVSRMCVQIGAIKAAWKCYSSAITQYDSLHERASELFSSQTISGSWIADVVPDELFEIVQLTHGLLLFTDCKYGSAMDVFQSLIDRVRQQRRDALLADSTADPLSPNKPAATFESSSSKKLHLRRQQLKFIASDANTADVFHSYLYSSADLMQPVLSVAVNNLSICALFTNKISTAISVLEGLIQENPMEYMTAYVVFNLSTMYDLCSPPETSQVKKTVLHKVAAMYNVNESVVPFQSYRLN